MNYDNNMKGALWINKKREKDTHPQMKGQCEINGVQYWVSAWTKKTQTGDTMQSLAFTPKEEPKQELGNIDKNFREDQIKDDLDFLKEIS